MGTQQGRLLLLLLCRLQPHLLRHLLRQRHQWLLCCRTQRDTQRALHLMVQMRDVL